jgi:hypothetical protein
MLKYLYDLDNIIVYYTAPIDQRLSNVNFINLFDFPGFVSFQKGPVPRQDYHISSDFRYIYFGKHHDSNFDGRPRVEYYNVGQSISVDTLTLPYPSYMFSGHQINRMSLDFFTKVTPKVEFQTIINRFKKMFGTQDKSISIRRGDFTQIHESYRNLTQEDVFSNVSFHGKVFMHSNSDEKWMEPFKGKAVWVEKWAKETYPYLTTEEIGLVSFYVAIEAKDFFGSYFSTFTGMIQRMIFAKTGNNDQKFISGLGTMKLDKGRIRGRNNAQLWNTPDSTYKDVYSWCQEWLGVS